MNEFMRENEVVGEVCAPLEHVTPDIEPKEPLNKKHSNKRIHVPKKRMTNYTIIPQKTSFFHVFPPQIRSITLKRADLPLGGAKIFLNTLHNKQICTRKQYIQFV